MSLNIFISPETLRKDHNSVSRMENKADESDVNEREERISIDVKSRAREDEAKRTRK